MEAVVNLGVLFCDPSIRYLARATNYRDKIGEIGNILSFVVLASETDCSIRLSISKD